MPCTENWSLVCSFQQVPQIPASKPPYKSVKYEGDTQDARTMSVAGFKHLSSEAILNYTGLSATIRQGLEEVNSLAQYTLMTENKIYNSWKFWTLY